MKLRTILSFSLLAVIVLAVGVADAQDSGAAVGSGAIQGGRIRLEIGKSHLMQEVESYSITDTGILEAQPTDDGNLILKGKSPGSTTILIRKPGLLGYIVYEVDVAGRDVEDVLRIAKEALGGIVGLSVRKEGNVVVLEGNVIDRNDGKRIDRQIEFHSNAILDLTERVYLQNDLTLLRDELASSNYSDVEAKTQIARDGQRVLLIRGTVASDFQRESVIGIASKFFEEENIIDQVKVVAPQIEVDVEVYTIDLTRSRSTGTNSMLAQFTSTDSTGWLIQGGPKARIIGSGDAPIGGNIRVFEYPQFTTGAFEDEFINALITDNLVTNIAKQHAAVRSGQKAVIENSRDTYVRVATLMVTDLKEVTSGQIMEIQPTILETGQYETAVSMELSQLVEPTADAEALAVAKRKVQTTYVSEEGEKVVLGGTKFRRGSDSEDGTPILRHIPIVNLLFRAKTRQEADVMQIYFMTLRNPNAFPAEDARMSEPAREQRDSIREEMEKNKGKLDFWLKWN